MTPGRRDGPYYRHDLAAIHDEGFGFHAEACAPGVLALLEPVLERRGLVVEVGCGSGSLTRHLIEAGHRVIATDASPAMVELTRRQVPGALDVRRLVLPEDRLPEADAIVSVGHVLNYLDDEAALHTALVALAAGVRPGGVLAVDLCDLTYGARRRGEPPIVWRRADWVLVTETSLPEPDHFVRDMTTFVRQGGDSWRRDDEVHHNVLVETSGLPELLGRCGLSASLRASFGAETLPEGMVVLVGERSPAREEPASGPGHRDATVER